MRHRRAILLTAPWIVMLFATACTSAPPSTSPPAPQTTSLPTGVSTAIVISQPIAGSVLVDPNVTIIVQVTGLSLVDKVGKSNVPGEGHVIYYADVAVPTTPGQPALSSPGTCAATSATSYTWQNVPDGVHTFSVQLVNNDNTPLSPAAVATVSVSIFTG